ncbi:MAG: IS256 family transposase [Alphaproteobacteria bacterium]|nr:IS256 family transposase [Alphaproteobacteria bacterium]
MIYMKDNNELSSVMEIINREGLDGLSQAVEIILNEAMKVERSQHLKAVPYERTEDRVGYANGFKPKQIKSRVGQLNVNVPQVRESDFYPSSLEKGMRSERALRAALAEMYVTGVSTRKVEKITQKLCGLSVTSSEVSRATKLLDEEMTQWRERSLGPCRYVYFDAQYEKRQEKGCILDMAVLTAIGVNEEGKRQVLGISISASEAEVHWREFFSSLIKRGLQGVELIISDAHEGLKAARKKVFPGVKWQRCQFHLQQNAQAYVPRIGLRKEVSSDIRAVFNAPNENEAQRLLNMTVEKYKQVAPKLSQWMENNIPEGLAVFQFPEEHRKKIRTTNGLERVNREIYRRTRVVSIFPNEDACLRLVSAILMEIHQDWATERKYLNLED